MVELGAPRSNSDLFRFVKLIIAFRKAHRSISRDTGWRDAVEWHGTLSPEASQHALAYLLRSGEGEGGDLYVMINCYWQQTEFAIPPTASWRRVIDTARESPNDIVSFDEAEAVIDSRHIVNARSVVVLAA